MKFSKELRIYRQNLLNNNVYINDKINNLYHYCIDYKYLKKHIKLIEKKENIQNDDFCCICLSELNTNYITTICNHKFHHKCFINICDKSKYCPLCRENITNKFINTNEMLIMQFMAMITLIINKINHVHDIIFNIINNLIIKYNIKKSELKKPFYSNCCMVLYTTIDYNRIVVIERINDLKIILKNYKYYNYKGIYKILKKIKKKSNVDLTSFIDEINFNLE